MYVWMHVCMHVCMSVCMDGCLCLYVCVCFPLFSLYSVRAASTAKRCEYLYGTSKESRSGTNNKFLFSRHRLSGLGALSIVKHGLGLQTGTTACRVWIRTCCQSRSPTDVSLLKLLAGGHSLLEPDLTRRENPDRKSPDGDVTP